MNLEQLQARLTEVNTAIGNTLNQYNILLGHKQEIEFHISNLDKESSDEAQPENSVDQTDVNSVENPVT